MTSMTDLHPLDAAMQSSFPTIMVPRKTEVAPMERNGVRYLVGQGGLWRQVKLPWLNLTHLIAPAGISLPYGDVTPEMTILCPAIPAELRKQFKRDALDALPNEMAAALIWNQNTGGWRYQIREASSSSSASVEYNEVKLDEGEYLIVDLHSHGRFEAFFSSVDDADDYGSMRFSGVIGNVDQQEKTFCMRLNMAGYRWDAFINGQGHLEVL